MMDDRSLAFFKRLLDAPGPSGFETRPAQLWREEAKAFATVEADVAGNCYATLNRAGKPRVMLTGHLDEIGVMVVHIDDDGFLYFAPIGGWDPQVLVGQRVRLDGRQGPVAGVVGKKAIHLIKTDERDKASKITDLWIDIGAKSKAEAGELVRIGDAGVLSAGLVELPNGRLVSRSVDNRVGSFVVLEALRRLAAKPPAACAVAVGTTQEEIAYTGGGARTSAFGLEPDAAIVVDVTHATDAPGIDVKQEGEHQLGSGAVVARGSTLNPALFELLHDTAEAEKIPFTLEASGRNTGTDADAVHLSRAGVPTGLVSIPLRYMHSPVELVELDDVRAAARLIAAFALALKPGTHFAR